MARTIDRFVCGYAVATVDEGLKLRRHGIEKEILCLGPVSAGRYQECLENDISLPMFEYRRAKELSCLLYTSEKDSIFLESVEEGSDNPYVNIIVARTADKDNELYKKVVD